MLLITALVAMIGIITVYNNRGIYKILDRIAEIKEILEKEEQ